MSLIKAELIKKDKDMKNNLLLTFKIENEEQKRMLDEEVFIGKYNLEITKDIKHRTLSQNALFWKLVFLIAQKQQIDPEEICKQIMLEAQSKYTLLEAPLEAQDTLKKNFKFVKFISVSMNDQTRGVFQCFYGTSKMNLEEFSVLIDKAKEYCHKLGIPIEDIENNEN